MKAYPPAVTKTTFLLSDSRRTRLKSLAAERGVTVTDLLAEGADLVLAKYQSGIDKEALLARARHAREQLRAGLFDGRGAQGGSVDDIVYRTSGGARRVAPPRKRRAR